MIRSQLMNRVTVVTDPEVMGGRPCIDGTRVPAESIVGNLRAGFSGNPVGRGNGALHQVSG